MCKKLLILLIFFLTMTSNSQSFVLLKNFNPKAKELKHTLNKTRDSLMLVCDINIQKVEIFNEDFEKLVKVEDYEAKIPLDDIPFGRFTIEAKLDNKTIIMELIGYEKKLSNSPSVSNNNIVYENGTMLDENLKTINSIPNNKIENMLSPKKTARKYTKRKVYWMSYKVYDKSGVSITMKLVSQILADRLIKRNKQELNSATGKSNELIIWEVYNSSKFMKAQLANPNYINSKSSDFFNVVPYYTSAKNLVAAN